MPRRKSSAPQSQSQQTLAFGPHPNKITKPSLPPPTSKPSKPSPLASSLPSPTSQPSPLTDLASPSPTTETPEANDATEETLTIRGIAKEKKSAEEEKAEKVGDEQVRGYWKRVEGERKSKRVHQTTLLLHEKILRHFDLSSQYGPCIGIPRLKRWKRAQTLGLNPPIEVLAVLLKERRDGEREGEGEGEEGGKGGMDVAYVDELLNGRGGL